MLRQGKIELRFVSGIVLAAFAGVLVIHDLLNAKRTEASVLGLPEPSAAVMPSCAHSLPVLRGIRLDAADPLSVDFLIDPAGRESVSKQDAAQIIRYFLAALTIPSKDLWVNLSPGESDRIITDILAETELGEVLLKQDYLLKQLASSLTHPDTPTGRQYWEHAGVGTPFMASSNKIWIVPDKVEVYEQGTTAVITEASFKLRCEDESQRILLPAITKDVNEGENFSQLRRVYHSIIMAAWFKQRFRESLYARYLDGNMVSGIDLADEGVRERVYELYLQAFKKGVYDLIKTDTEPESGRKFKRRYFSGGVMADLSGRIGISNDKNGFAASALARRPVEVFSTRMQPQEAAASAVVPVERAFDDVFVFADMYAWLATINFTSLRALPDNAVEIDKIVVKHAGPAINALMGSLADEFIAERYDRVVTDEERKKTALIATHTTAVFSTFLHSFSFDPAERPEVMIRLARIFLGDATGERARQAIEFMRDVMSHGGRWSDDKIFAQWAIVALLHDIGKLYEQLGLSGRTNHDLETMALIDRYDLKNKLRRIFRNVLTAEEIDEAYWVMGVHNSYGTQAQAAKSIDWLRDAFDEPGLRAYLSNAAGNVDAGKLRRLLMKSVVFWMFDAGGTAKKGFVEYRPFAYIKELSEHIAEAVGDDADWAQFDRVMDDLAVSLGDARLARIVGAWMSNDLRPDIEIWNDVEAKAAAMIDAREMRRKDWDGFKETFPRLTEEYYFSQFVISAVDRQKAPKDYSTIVKYFVLISKLSSDERLGGFTAAYRPWDAAVMEVILGDEKKATFGEFLSRSLARARCDTYRYDEAANCAYLIDAETGADLPGVKFVKDMTKPGGRLLAVLDPSASSTVEVYQPRSRRQADSTAIGWRSSWNADLSGAQPDVMADALVGMLARGRWVNVSRVARQFYGNNDSSNTGKIRALLSRIEEEHRGGVERIVEHGVALEVRAEFMPVMTADAIRGMTKDQLIEQVIKRVRRNFGLERVDFRRLMREFVNPADIASTAELIARMSDDEARRRLGPLWERHHVSSSLSPHGGIAIDVEAMIAPAAGSSALTLPVPGDAQDYTRMMFTITGSRRDILASLVD